MHKANLLLNMRFIIKLQTIKVITIMEEQSNRSKLFCMDNSPLKPANYIFDTTYRNMSEKKKFQKDPKFAYFNAIVKLKQNYMKNKRDVYDFMFKTPEQEQDRPNQNIFTIDDSIYEIQRQAFRMQSMPRQVFHIQKINSHAFKIYKQKKINVNKTSISTDLKSLNNINFKLHFRGRAKFEQREKPKIQTLMKEYKRMQEMKSRLNPQNQQQGQKFRASSLRTSKNFKQSRVEFNQKRKNQNRNSSQNEILSIINQSNKRSKSRTNMSELALRIS